MNRRQCGKMLFSAAAVAAIPFQWAGRRTRHTLYGDGVTDDTRALRALCDGEPVEMPDGSIQQMGEDMIVHIPQGTFVFSASIPTNAGTTIMGAGYDKTILKGRKGYG